MCRTRERSIKQVWALGTLSMEMPFTETGNKEKGQKGEELKAFKIIKVAMGV